jgi:hypothetical protein
MFVHNSIKFTSLNINIYCLVQDFEVCAIQLKSVYDKLCILAIYRSPLGNFNTFLTNFELILHTFLIVNLILMCVETLILITLQRVIRKSTQQYFTVL